MILRDGIELNISDNGQIISNEFNDFFINVTLDLLTKLRNQQSVINDNADILHNNNPNQHTFDPTFFYQRTRNYQSNQNLKMVIH